MANSFNSGSAHVDTTGIGVAKACKVAYILFTPSSANGSIVIYDHASATTNYKTLLAGATANNTLIFDLSAKPMNFVNGIYVTVTNAVATLILTSEGAST